MESARKIVIPTDLSERSEKSIRYGILMAKQLGKEVEVLHVIDSFDFGVNFLVNENNATVVSAEIMERKRAEAERLYNNVLNNLKRTNEELPPIRLNMAFGFIADKISESVQNPDTFLVILSDKTQAESNYRDINKNQNEIIKRSYSPVLIIPNGVFREEIKKVVYATNYQEQDISNIIDLIEIIKYFDAELEVVHISEQYDFDAKLREAGMKALLLEQTHYEKLSVRTVVYSDMVYGIDDFANETNANMIVLLRESKSLFKAIFGTNNAKKIIYKTNLPVLLFRQK